MKRCLISLSLFLSTTLLSAQTVPSLVNYQGRLLDNAGNPRSGNVSITVAIHTNQTLSAEVYSENIGTVAVNNGMFAFRFGAGAGFTGALANAEAWLEVTVDQSAVGPRQRLIAVPYAVAAATVRGSDLFVDPVSGNVGVGTQAPGTKLAVAGDGVPLVINSTNGNQFKLGWNDGAVVRGYLGARASAALVVGSANATTLLTLLNDGKLGVGLGQFSPRESLEIAGAVKIGTTLNPTPVAGTIRWTGSAFEGFDGSNWVPLSAPARLVTPELVTVGNPGNADDTASNGLGGNSGAVPYTYSIGKYEVTNDEYTKFLNAVDPNGLNALALYDTSMASNSSNGGITFTAANADGTKYAVKAGFANKPVVYVSFYDAMRYCNWLHNGGQAGGDTENGAYTLLGNTATPSNGATVTRNAGAQFAVPTEDEWYKAAYHQPAGAGGDSDNYWLYPTRSDSAPNMFTPPGNAPSANYDFGVGSVTAVGAYTTTTGYYGTYDMAGNVFEWTEEINSSSRVLRGGSWNGPVDSLQSDSPDSFPPVLENFDVGFRVSSP